MLRIKRITGRILNLYYISSSSIDLKNEIIEPSIPNNFLTTIEKIGNKVKRTRLYTNISDALSSIYLGQNIKGSELKVWRALGVRNESLIVPSLTECPYLLVLDDTEYWYLSSLRFELVGKIKVDKLEEKLSYNYGQRSLKAPLYKWNWSEILEKWEKPKLKKNVQ